MSAFMIVLTLAALVVLVATCWRTHSWVAMVGFALVAGGGFVFTLREEYFDFSFYLFQILLILLGSAFLVRGRGQKLLIGVTTAFLVAAGLAKDSLSLDHLASIEYSIYLYAAYALLPLLFYSPVTKKEEDLEKVICFQQTWLRILFFHLSVIQGINIAHYDLYSRYVFEFGLMAGIVILFAIVMRKKLFWTLAQQSVISLLVLSVELDRAGGNSHLIYGWILLLALSVLLPKKTNESTSNITKFVKRLEFGAFGGGVFWSLILVVHFGATSSVEGSILWTFIIFLAGLFSWMRDVPSPAIQESKAPDHYLIGTRAAVQLLLASIFIYPM